MARLAEAPQDEADAERKRLFDFRYDFKKEPPVDRFVQAWTGMRLYENTVFLMNNLKTAKTELRAFTNQLGITGSARDPYLFAEWDNFARFYITSCLTGKTYNSKFLTFFKMNADELAMKIAEDIDYGTRVIPNIAELDAALFADLKEILLAVYFELVPNGRSQWKRYNL